MTSNVCLKWIELSFYLDKDKTKSKAKKKLYKERIRKSLFWKGKSNRCNKFKIKQKLKYKL